MSQVVSLPVSLPVRPEPKRDRWKRYLLPHPETGVEMSWTRATTWAKTLDGDYALTLWKQRMTAMGVAARPDLLKAVSEIVDPEEPEEKKKLNALVAEALEWSGGSVRAALGTGVHSFLEAIDGGYSDEIAYRVATQKVYEDVESVKDKTTRALTLGRALLLLQPAVIADVAAYREARQRYGVKMHPNFVERICVLPGIGAKEGLGGIAGTLDRIGLWNGRLVICDVKTGRWSESYASQSISVQLALYAHASHLWDASTARWSPMPEVDQKVGLVFDVHDGACRVLEVDIAAGWNKVQLCGQVRDWRDEKGLVREISA